MSEDRKAAEESDALTGDQEAVSDEGVDEMAETLMEAPEAASTEMAIDEGETEVTAEDEEQVLEEEIVKDEIDIQIDLLQDHDWVIRREAVITLGEMADERCVEPLVRCLRDGDWQVREAAVEAVAQIGSPAVESLIKFLRDWEARKYVLRTLGKINDERVLDPLISMLRSDEFKDDATRALIELGSPAVPKLIIALTDRDEFIRKQAILALGDIKDPQAVDPLIALLQDQDWWTRLTAAAALEKIGEPRGRDAIKPLMKDQDLVVRMRVERILAAWKKQPEKANA